MRLHEYLRGQPRGTKSRVARDAGITFPTMIRYSRRWAPVMPYDLAVRVSAATGGACSLADLMFPERKKQAAA